MAVFSGLAHTHQLKEKTKHEIYVTTSSPVKCNYGLIYRILFIKKCQHFYSNHLNYNLYKFVLKKGGRYSE